MKKVLDEKGKLFGKINLIDLLVVVVLVFVIAAVGWKVFGGKISTAVARTLPTVEFEVLCQHVDPNTAAFAPSEIEAQIMNNGDMMDAYITNCEVLPEYTMVVGADGKPAQVENPQYRNVRFTVKGQVRDAGNAYAIGTQELRVGKPHIVKTLKLEITGNIISLTELPADAGNANG